MIAAAFMIVGVMNYHVPFSRVKTIEYSFRGPDGTISHVYPVARVRDVARADGRTYRSMIEDPLYFDVRTLLPYGKARIELVYRNKTAVPLKIGVKLKNGETAFDIKPFANITKDGEWSRGEVAFDLSPASYYNSKYTFAFSVPGLRAESAAAGEVRLSQMTLTLERDPISWKEIMKLWKKR